MLLVGAQAYASQLVVLGSPPRRVLTKTLKMAFEARLFGVCNDWDVM